MSFNRNHSKHDPDHTIGGRLVAVFASLVFSVTLMLLFWLLFNGWLYAADDQISIFVFAVPVAALAVLAVAQPKLATDVLGWLIDLFFKLGKYW